MNHHYKVVFNKTTQVWVAVCEYAKSGGKGSAGSVESGSDDTKKELNKTINTRNTLSAALCALMAGFGIAAFGATPAFAQTTIIADQNALAKLRPVVLPTASGITQVNIQSPNHKGLSNNHYSQFDVGREGVILNNARKPINTNLAGFVDGNPNMARGEARVILNQVNSTHPSHLNGFTEIAGGRAELIIANPVGIKVDGGGFINASNVKLSGAAPTIDSEGNLHINSNAARGNIEIVGQGLNTQNVDYTTLIGDAIAINAATHAGTELTTHHKTRLDVGKLGGMYAGYIHLVGTDKGLGVNNAGDINSQSSLHLDANGKLTNTGFIGAKSDLNIDTKNTTLTNTGTMVGASINIQSKDLHNEGYLSSTGILNTNKQDTITNTGTISGGALQIETQVLNNTGSISQVGMGRFDVNTSEIINSNNATIGMPLAINQNIAINPPATFIKATHTQIAPTSSATGSRLQQNVIASNLVTNGYLKAKNLHNSTPDGRILASGDINIQTANLTNSGKSSINAKSLQVEKNFANQGGRIQLENVNWQVAGFDNQGGELLATKNLSITSTDSVNNQAGVLQAGNTLTINAKYAIHNERGVINGDALSIHANNLLNQDGRIQATGSATINIKASLDNNQGQIKGSQTTLMAETLTNNQGVIHGQILSINADKIDNGGEIYARNDANIQSRTLINSQKALIGAADNLNIDTQTLLNQGTLVASLLSDGSIDKARVDVGNLIIHATDGFTGTGKHLAGNMLSIQGNNVNLANSDNEAKNITLRSKNDLNLNLATTKAQENAVIVTEGNINHSQAMLSAEHTKLSANNIDNKQGSITSHGIKEFYLVTNELNNEQGVIKVGSDKLNLDVNHLNNTKGLIAQSGTTSNLMQVNADILTNQEGRLLSVGSQRIGARSLNNEQGVIQGVDFAIHAKQMNNHLGKLSAINAPSHDKTNALELDILNNNQGRVDSQTGSLDIHAKLLDNDQGVLSSQGILKATTDILQNSGLIYSSQDLHIQNTKNVSNQGVIGAKQDITIEAKNLTQNKAGKLIAGLNEDGQTLEVNTQTLKIHTQDAQENNGINVSTGTIHLMGEDLLLTNSQNQAQNIIMQASGNTLDLGSATILAGQALNLSTKDNINTSKAKIQSHTFAIDAKHLNNQAGTIVQSGKSDLTLNLQSLDNTRGVISANAQELNIKINTVDNNQGQLVHQGNKTDIQVNKLINQSGLIYGQNTTLKIDDLNNNQGKLLTSNLNAKIETFNNTQGLVHQSNDGAPLTLTVGTLNNQNTQADEQGILSKKLVIDAKTIDNSQGQLKSEHLKLTANHLGNNQGYISAKVGAIDTGIVYNQGGKLIFENLALTSNQGYAHGRHDTLSANQLTLKTANTFDNYGDINIPSININAHTINNHRQANLEATNTTLHANNLINRGTINGDKTHIQVGTLDNLSHGRIYGGHLAIDARTLNNTPDLYTKTQVSYCTISSPNCVVSITKTQDGSQTYISSEKLKELELLALMPVSNLSENESKELAKYSIRYYQTHSEPAPVIAARQRLDIGATTLNNNPNKARADIFNQDFDGQAQILSNGSLHIGGSLSNNQEAVGKALTVNNTGATIQSMGAMSINAVNLSNKNGGYKQYDIQQGSPYRVTEFITTEDGKTYIQKDGETYIKLTGWNDHWVKELVTPNGKYYNYNSHNYQQTNYASNTVESDPALIRSGGSLFINSQVAMNDKSIVMDANSLSLKQDGADATRFGFTNESALGTQYFTRTDRTITTYILGTKPRSINRKSKRPYTHYSNPKEESDDSVDIKDNQALPILNAGINTQPNLASINQANAVAEVHSALTTLLKDIQKGGAASTEALSTLNSLSKAQVSSLTDVEQRQLESLLAQSRQGNKIDKAVLTALIGKVDHRLKELQSTEVRTQTQGVRLSGNGLYLLNPDSQASYLLQSDPKFTNYKHWLSSDYMLASLSKDPNIAQKRLSDGYGEQTRLADDYFVLTGRHFLQDYRSSDDAYKALMDSALAQKDRLNLRVGIALSDEQMSKLSNDIVWMVSQSVPMPDGSTQEVLVPKLYVHAKKADISGNLGGIYTKDASFDVQDLKNQGTIYVRNHADIKALTFDNINGGNILSDTAVIDIKSHLNGNDGILQSHTSMSLNVGGTFSGDNASLLVGNGAKGQINKEGDTLNTLSVNAGRIDAKALTISNQGGNTYLQGIHGVNLNVTNHDQTIASKANDNNYFTYQATTQKGTNIQSAGDTIIHSKEGGITAKALQVHSGGNSVLIAQDDIKLEDGRQTASLNSSHQYNQNNWYGKKQVVDTQVYQLDRSITSNISGQNFIANSQNGDIMLQGTNAKAVDAIQVTADKGKIQINSSLNKAYQDNSRSTKNFYQGTATSQGSYQENVEHTGLSGATVYINGKEVSTQAAMIQGKDRLKIGNALLATNPDGTLKQDENGKPIVLSGGTQNLTLGTMTLVNKTWNENSKESRGIAKVAMQAVGVVAGALNIGNGITTTKSSKENSISQEEQVSQLKAKHVEVGAKQVMAFGTDFETTESGSTTILGQNILLGSAQKSTETTSTSTRQTITGEGIKLGKDHIQLGAVVHTNTKNSQTTKEDSHKGVTINSQNTLVLADMKSGTLVTQGTKFKEQEAGGSLLLGAKTTLLDGVINGTSTTQDNKTDTTRIGASVHHVAIDTAVAAANLVDATKAVNDARLALKDAKEAVANGTLDANAITDYELNLAMATANAANAQIALGSTAATAATTYPTLGFSAKVSASHTKDKHQETKTTENFTGTQINSTNTTLVGDSLTAKGLEAQIGTLTVANLGHLNLTHGTTKDTYTSKGDSKTVNASYSTSGVASVGIGTQSNKADSTSTTAHDSKLIVGSLNGNAKVTTLNGAHITAHGGDYQTDKLIIATSQNSQNTHAKKQGGNIGLGTGSLNLGYNNQKNQSDITTNNTPSGITYVNADASHGGSHSLTANTTINTGGVITAINQDKEGNVTNSNLNFTTQTLTTNDLVATQHSQTRGINTSVGTAAKGDDAKLSSVGLGLTKEGHQKETKAFATISKGATVTDAITHNGQAQTSTDLTQTNINTDALTTQQVIKDQKTGGLNFDAMVDTRVFSKEGREGIKKEQERLDENLKATAKITAAAGVQVVATTANVLTGNQTLTQAIQSAKAPAKMAKAIQDNPQLAAILDAYQKGEYHNLTLSQKALQDLSDATGISTEVLLTSITAQKGKQGATNKTLTVIDTHDEPRQDSIQTLAHELDHIRGGKNETLADLAGFAAKLNTDAAIIANQDTINPIKAQLGDGKDAQTTAQNQALLEGNDKTFVENHDGREGEWEYSLYKEDVEKLLIDYNKKWLNQCNNDNGCSKTQIQNMREAMLESARQISVQNNENLMRICETNKEQCLQEQQYLKDSLLFALTRKNIENLDSDIYKKLDPEEPEDLENGNNSEDHINLGTLEVTIAISPGFINKTTVLQDMVVHENLKTIMDLEVDSNKKEAIYNYLRSRSFNGSNQKIESGRLLKDFSLWLSNKRDIRLLDDYGDPDSVPNLVANETLQAIKPDTMTGLDRTVNNTRGVTDALIEAGIDTAKFVKDLPNIAKQQGQIIANTNYPEVIADIAKNQTLAEDAIKLYEKAVDSTTNFFENVDKSSNSQYNHEVIPASQAATEYGIAVGEVIATTAIPALKAGKVATIVDNVTDVATTANKHIDAPTPNNTHTGTLLASTECSFHGSMQVKTLFGYKPISSIRINDWVFAKNEITGETNYRQVLQTINSIDPDTTRITIVNGNGVKQTIISDGLHPYFVDFTGDTTPPKPSTGHSYKGNLTHAYWVGAKDIEIGHRLIDDKGNYQTVIAIHTEATPLNSYNLEVDTDHTFFIKGIDGVESVWVHNDCYRKLPNNAQKQPDGTYTANVNGRQITLIETKIGNETVYYTKDHQAGDPYRNKAGQAVDESGKYIKDPNKPQDSADKYKWIDEHRHPDPNVQSSFGTSKPVANSTYFTTQTEWQAPGKGTGLKYTVYQQDIDLNARPLAHLGNNKTNAELMQKGNAPYVLKNGKYEQIQLHHSQQDGRGSLFELTEQTHLKTGDDKGGKALHPYGQNQHPDFPVERDMFDKDRIQYWKDRIKQLQSEEVN